MDPGYDVGATSSAQDDIVVEVLTDEGLVGIGESDINPWIARACIEAPGTHTMGQSLREMLVGEDPVDVERLWEKLYLGSAMNGRRGAGVCALGAIDIALHDLRGKVFGKPCHALLGGPVRASITPYASLEPGGRDFLEYKAAMVEWAQRAKALGFRAAKLEITPSGPYKHKGIEFGYEQMADLIGAVRDSVGPAFVIMVDVQYAFPDARTCLTVTRDWEQFDLYFLETPLPSDDLEGYAVLGAESGIPIAAGEWLTTRFEFIELMDHGGISVVQPDVGRVGGLTEAVRVCRLAEQRGLKIVPHAWKTGISIAAAVQMAAVAPNCAFIEFLPSDLSESALRRELTVGGPVMVDGVIRVGDEPGLGVAIDNVAMQRFEAKARSVRP